MLVSPAEPAQLKVLGKSSSVPEGYGCDFLISSPVFGLVGIQRKELSDLVASLHDSRVKRELIQMKELDWGIWVIEGKPSWTGDGQALWTRTSYTRDRHLGIIFYLTFSGFAVVGTESIQETLHTLSRLESWLMKEDHAPVGQRGGARGEFGKPDITDWQVHFLEGLPGVGYERAKAIVKHFGGLPFTMAGDLADVPGIGKGTAKRVSEVIERD